MLNLIIIKGIKIEIVWFHIMQLLVTVLNKNKWILDENKRKLSHWYKYLFKRYPLHHIPPAKLYYILIVWCKVEQSVGQQKSCDWPLNQWKEQQHSGYLVWRKNFLSFFSIL